MHCFLTWCRPQYLRLSRSMLHAMLKWMHAYGEHLRAYLCARV